MSAVRGLGQAAARWSFGSSDKPRTAYDVGRHAAHLSAWLDTRPITRICLVGHSFGAEIAARLAVIRPNLISALVLASPTTDPSARSRRGLIRRWTADLFVEAPPWQAAVLARDGSGNCPSLPSAPRTHLKADGSHRGERSAGPRPSAAQISVTVWKTTPSGN